MLANNTNIEGQVVMLMTRGAVVCCDVKRGILRSSILCRCRWGDCVPFWRSFGIDLGAFLPIETGPVVDCLEEDAMIDCSTRRSGGGIALECASDLDLVKSWRWLR